ncbi:MAG: ROK family protein [Clostridia bacterium]|nr:ROK family protein [Clostridia bacterium]
MKYYLSIDVGGSAIKVGILDEQGTILYKESFKTPRDTYDHLLSVLTKAFQWGKSQKGICGVAMSLPFVLDSITGEVLSEGPFPFIFDKDILKDLENITGLPVSVENDGNCAALAEIWIGSAKEAQNMALIVSGTGIGGALIQNREVWHGKNHFSGEFGMTLLGWDANGVPFSWSEVGSTYGLVRAYARKKNIDVNTITGKMIFSEMDAGDEDAKSCVDHFVRYFAQGIHNLQHTFDPELILIGGGISEREDLISRINDALNNLYKKFSVKPSRPVVGKCTFGADANLIGALYHHLNCSRL